ncbi:MAG: flagellar hook-basal body complex protein FliE [Phenylobacterium sp.]|jgi:flagellar hook-basal body complex protein FliE|uniref:Flagellar hook-basal body complex protein FliE n=1 Tax=Phenylobacterium ferrooxidans TaxID=2982689 RepID=A0ABW6CMQ1_9CAUL|nr:flagellar hook-basal body complex protein FliE [Phenylobacterium sp.]MDO8324268.1 flagellar hook-basal body complex protein FliE [Phenylobacterium sp.]MDO8913809.1 flagellar hook-basal body complex protein FliE [Phenylobacterium sp.]MDP2008898.1 flagellar hook-basal body complex protein FliE [Phenylobacterium sp.]MDP3100508.1 flagellar hook-basal body complex protein FliE [Phenylobacterium sp.]MDP3635737.1 flagellar hook-basal body complex protein FliE [Phenylobacterium sp.]
MMTALAAAKAYASTQGVGAAKPTGAAAEGGLDFGSLVKSAMTDAMQASKHAENQIKANVAGKAELIDVVTSISAAEASLETVMAVRDQVISAYQEIMRMPI